MKAVDSYTQCAVLAAVLAGAATLQAQETAGTLKVDGKTAESYARAHSLGGGLPWSDTFSVGIDTCTAVDEKDYQVPFAFTGELNKLTVKLGPKRVSAEEKEAVEKKRRDAQ